LLTPDEVEEEASKVLAHVDANADGKLSFEETFRRTCKSIEKFRESEPADVAKPAASGPAAAAEEPVVTTEVPSTAEVPDKEEALDTDEAPATDEAGSRPRSIEDFPWLEGDKVRLAFAAGRPVNHFLYGHGFAIAVDHTASKPFLVRFHDGSSAKYALAFAACPRTRVVSEFRR
jgi:hypothetical protein